MATTEDQVKRITEHFDTAKEICLALAPLSTRAQRRLLAYFYDLVTDADSDAGLKEVEILKQVHAILGIEFKE